MGFTAEVLRDNRAMQHIFNSSPYKVTSTPNQEVCSFSVEFT